MLFIDEVQAGALQEFFDSTDGVCVCVCVCVSCKLIHLDYFPGKFHTTEVKNWVDELKTERSKNSNTAVK